MSLWIFNTNLFYLIWSHCFKGMEKFCYCLIFPHLSLSHISSYIGMKTRRINLKCIHLFKARYQTYHCLTCTALWTIGTIPASGQRARTYSPVDAKMKLTDNVVRSFRVAKFFRENNDRINNVDFSANGETLISSSDDDSIVIYDCQNGS